MRKETVKRQLIDILFYVVGSVIYAVAIAMFISPAKISPGGFTGVSLIFNFLFKVPVGVTMLILNIPLILISLRILGWRFIIGTAIATPIMSLCIDIGEKIIKPFYSDIILCALFGGILSGVGLGLVLLRGATTGGMDIIGKLINYKYPHFSIGRIILLGDAVVIMLSAMFYKNFSNALYSAVTVFISSVVVDKLLSGADRGKLIYVVTDKASEISRKIIEDVERGVTVIKATGAYSGEEKKILLCAVRAHQVALVNSVVKNFDQNAFIIICDSGEIRGNGFKKT